MSRKILENIWTQEEGKVLLLKEERDYNCTEELEEDIEKKIGNWELKKELKGRKNLRVKERHSSEDREEHKKKERTQYRIKERTQEQGKERI